MCMSSCSLHSVQPAHLPPEHTTNINSMFLAAATPRSIARGATLSLSKTCNKARATTEGVRQTAQQALLCSSSPSSFASPPFRPTSAARRSAVGIESLDDCIWDVAPPPAPKTDKSCIVNSHTEWDPLEEVIVGCVHGATIPEWHVSGKAVWPAKHWDMYKTMAGQPFPPELARRGRTIICTAEIFLTQ